MPAPVLLFAYGNISRGDDALAPLLLERIQCSGATSVADHPIKFLSDYLMQIEHVTDMHGCERILLIDADQSIDEPFRFYKVKERQETSYTTHGMTPSTLLHTFKHTYKQSAPATSMLAVRGYNFELGQGLSTEAQNNLLVAEEFLNQILFAKEFSLWDERLAVI
ncbi:MAG: hydrogenase maturation protease [Gammaproteobacteria bacterium]|nr:hydrogenase maturation protease [Gammaproteobacteria bacterium]